MELFLLLIGIIPSFAWLIFFLQEDPKPEPKKLIIYAFILGILATPIVFGFQLLFNLAAGRISLLVYPFIAIFFLALIEEIFKFFAVYLGIRKSRFFDEPIDAMIYMIVAALGFAAAENIMIILNIYQESALVAWGEIFRTTTLRFLGATLLHALSSGLVGYYWAVGILRRRIKRFIIFGIILATLLHTIFNYLILTLEDKIIYATLILIVAGILVLNDFEHLKRYNIIN